MSGLTLMIGCSESYEQIQFDFEDRLASQIFFCLVTRRVIHSRHLAWSIL